MRKVILTEKGNGIYELKINRPEKHNAIDFETIEELKKHIEYINDHPHRIRAVVITGEGERAFCSGGDIKAFHDLKTKEEAFKMLSSMGEVLYKVMTLPIPTFALLGGMALGGGCEIATACDIRLAKADIEMGFIQGNLAITTGWGGATMLFEKLAYDKALLLLTSANKFTTEDGIRQGFIHEVFQQETFRQDAYQFIENSLVKHPSVLGAYKKVKIKEWVQKGLKEKMIAEIDQCAELWVSEEHHKAVDSFINRIK
ncbi:enoyl-CoA hydratase/isomerase family protein [Metabacillus herbersteinensis]|uniref:Enoyl-CoA hydratase/isomerase family protein n=1 Tax=Metabacillus herbersteinensis TaxID=283816 RepID=A0ABV6GBX3_9BACI